MKIRQFLKKLILGEDVSLPASQVLAVKEYAASRDFDLQTIEKPEGMYYRLNLTRSDFVRLIRDELRKTGIGWNYHVCGKFRDGHLENIFICTIDPWRGQIGVTYCDDRHHDPHQLAECELSDDELRVVVAAICEYYILTKSET